MTDIMDARLARGVFSQISPDPHEFPWSPGCADSSVFIPWTMYRVQGDTRLAERWYKEMKSHVEYCRSQSPGFIGPNVGYGDWLAVDTSTPKDLIATALFARSSFVLSEMAAALGQTADAADYRQLFENIRTAFQSRFVSPDGTIGSGSQAGYAMAIAYDLLSPPQQSLAADRLKAAIEARGNHLSTGFAATHLLLPALSKVGRSDIAYRLIDQNTYPSWGYFLAQGATSLWERWDGRTDAFNPDPMNSFNHANLGTCTEWFYRYVLGIDLLEPGFTRIQISPTPGLNLTHASGHYDSPVGRISSDWTLNGDLFELNVMIPPNATAEISVPAWSSATVSEGGASANGITLLRENIGLVVYQVGSGCYQFHSSLAMPAPVISSFGRTDSTVTISWTPVAGAINYELKRATVAGGPYVTIADHLTATSFTDTGLTAGATYFYFVTTLNPAGATLESPAVSVTTYTAIENWRYENFGTIANSGDAADTADPDGDGMVNHDEWIAGTNPRDRASVVRIGALQPNGNDIVISFATVAGKKYRVEVSSDLQNSSWNVLLGGISGTGGVIQVTDVGAALDGSRFYRIVVGP